MKKLFVLYLLAFMTFASTAFAQSTPPNQDHDERARIHFQAGTDYFERGDYENALRELQIAHEMSGRAALLFNIGACLERLGRFTEAADQLDAFVAAVGPTDAAAIRERAQRLRARGAAATTTVTATTTTATLATTDTTVEVQTATTATTVDTTQHQDTPARGRSPHVASWITLGVGIAGLATFGVLGGLALGENSSLEMRCGMSCTADQVSGLGSLTLGADISLAVGVVLSATGLVLALTTDDGSSESPTVELGPGSLRVLF